MHELSNLPNLGKVLSEQLEMVDIKTISDFKTIGSEKAFLRIKTIDNTACLNKLYALEGAIQNIRWHKLPKIRKDELKDYYTMIENSNLKLKRINQKDDHGKYS